MVEHHTRSQNPKQLVDEFKKSGEFDRLRRQLLTHFASSDAVRPLMSRVEEIVREKLAGDERLEHKTREAVHAEVMEDMERYPIVERAVSDLDILKDESLIRSVEQYARNIVRGESNETTQLWEAKPSRKKQDDEDEDNDGSSDYTEDEDADDGDVITDARKKTTTISQSPDPETGKIAVAGEALPHNSHLQPQAEIKPTTPRSATQLSRTRANAASICSHTPPWPDSLGDIKRSTTSPNAAANPKIYSGQHSFGMQGFAGEVVMNGVPVGHTPDSGGLGTRKIFQSHEHQNMQPPDETTEPSQINADETGHSAGLEELVKNSEVIVNSENPGVPLSLRASSPTHIPPLFSSQRTST